MNKTNPKQDRQGVRQAKDLEQKYDFGLLDKAKSFDSSLVNRLNQSITELKSDVTLQFEDVAEIIDDVQGDVNDCFEQVKDVQEDVNTCFEKVERITNEEINNICV